MVKVKRINNFAEVAYLVSRRLTGVSGFRIFVTTVFLNFNFVSFLFLLSRAVD